MVKKKTKQSVFCKYFIGDMNRIANHGNCHIPICGKKLLPRRRLVGKKREKTSREREREREKSLVCLSLSLPPLLSFLDPANAFHSPKMHTEERINSYLSIEQTQFYQIWKKAANHENSKRIVWSMWCVLIPSKRGKLPSVFLSLYTSFLSSFFHQSIFLLSISSLILSS